MLQNFTHCGNYVVSYYLSFFTLLSNSIRNNFSAIGSRGGSSQNQSRCLLRQGDEQYRASQLEAAIQYL